MHDLTYINPSSMSELLSALGDDGPGTAVLIAGGTNLIPFMRENKPGGAALVDISGVEGMSSIKEEDGRIKIGAAATMAEIEKNGLIVKKAPLLAQAAAMVGNPMTRNRATIGGNVANASPAADTAPPLLALDASVHLAGPEGDSTVPLEDFFLGYRKTGLNPGQVITHFSFAASAQGAHQGFAKLGLRDAASISVVSLAWVLEVEADVCSKARVALGSVAPVPMRAKEAEAVLQGKKPDQEFVARAVETLRNEISPVSDLRASGAYRRHAAGVMFERCLRPLLG